MRTEIDKIREGLSEKTETTRNLIDWLLILAACAAFWVSTFLFFFK